jgi:hypothetical protein
MSPIDLNDPVAVLLAATNALQQANIESALYGGLALAVYGEARETKDADLAVAGVETEDVRRALQDQGFDVLLAFDRMQFGGQFVSRLTLVGDGSTNTVDLVEPRSPAYAERVLGRAADGEIRRQRIRVVSAEDFIILKLLATRERDLEDAKSVIGLLNDALDIQLITEELNLLSAEISDYDLDQRWRRVRPSS